MGKTPKLLSDVLFYTLKYSKSIKFTQKQSQNTKNSHEELFSFLE